MKYHYSEKTQKAELCSATDRPCPLGGIHGTKDQVQSHIDQSNIEQFEVLPSLSKRVEIVSHPLPKYENPDEQEFWDTMRKDIGTFVWNGCEFALQPKGEKYSTTYCTTCNTVLTKDHSYFADSKYSTCESCGHSLRGPYNTGVVLSRDSLKYFDDNSLKTDSWYHTTQNPKWADSLNNDRSFIHLGTEKASQDRCKTLLNDPDSPTYLYEIEIVDDARVHDKTYYEDPYQDNSPLTSSDPSKYPKIDFNGVTRYVNEMEDPGSISLLANPKVIRVKSSRVINPETRRAYSEFSAS